MPEMGEADPMTEAALIAVGRFGEATERQMAALRSAIEILRAAYDLEAELERTGEYVITGDTMTKVRDRKQDHAEKTLRASCAV